MNGDVLSGWSRPRSDPTNAAVVAEQLLAADHPRRWSHVQAVANQAVRLAAFLGMDTTWVASAAWLHDIGYAREVVETGFHPLDGARYLRARRWDDKVCRLVAHHTDARHHASPMLAGQLCREFQEVDGLERDVLWAADATCGPNGELLTLDERIAEIGRRYGREHRVTACMIDSRTALAAAIGRVAAACR